MTTEPDQAEPAVPPAPGEGGGDRGDAWGGGPGGEMGGVGRGGGGGPAGGGDPGGEVLGGAALSRPEVRRRALAGVSTVAARGLAVRLLGLGGNVVLARMLLPRDFGLVAFGTTVMTVVTFLSDAGMGAALIRRPAPPRRLELESLLGFQIVLTSAIAAASVLVAAPFGQAGRVTAVMVAALPLMSFRVPPAVLFERQLQYRKLALVELAETVAYVVWAIATVAAGWGVWGMATGSLARSVAASGVALAVSRERVVRPRLALAEIRGLLGFGMRFQAVDVVYLAYNQALNVGIAGIGGVAALGVWSLTQRLMQVPKLFYDSIWSVSFPTMSRLTEAGEDVRPLLQRAHASSAVLGGVLSLVLVAPGHALVTTVFGGEWRAVGDVLPWVAMAFILSGPLTVAATGYLYAVGDAGTVLRNAVLASLVTLPTTLALLDPVGPAALGIGVLAGAVASAAVLGSRLVAASGARVMRTTLVTTAVGGVAGAAGWLTAGAIDQPLVAVAAGLALAEAIFLGGLLVVARPIVLDTVRLVADALRAGTARS